VLALFADRLAGAALQGVRLHHLGQLEPCTPGHRQGGAPDQKGANPRLIVTSLPAAAIDSRTLHERVYCARGEMENRIKEQQLDLFADRTSTATMRVNQLRLRSAAFAYVLLEALRRIGLRHTQFQDATCGTIRLKLLKLCARVTVSVRRIKVAIASPCPYRTEFALAHLRLATWTGPPAARAAA
jgi:hypothetical protein